jgi:pimeloyl-ACP methyl ester carboxylesterase
VINDPYRWLTGYRHRNDGPKPAIQSATFSLNTLAANGYLSRNDVSGMLLDTGLKDFSWDVVWSDTANTADMDIDDRVLEADGYVVFIHGWTGTRGIWEDLPAEIVHRNPNLVALVVDHNGFGETTFVDTTPDYHVCNPIAAMRSIERWLELLHLRRQAGERKLKTVNFVGHSMGGAALFFLDEPQWRLGEQTRTAIAPALLLHDDTHRAFYTTLGLGIGLVGRLRILDFIDDLVSPSILEVLAEGATQRVKDEHARVYDETPKSITARTFAAMGIIDEHPPAHRWDLMRVILGHRDRLVGLIPMLDLLQELDFDVDQVRVVMGTHYLFSVGEDYNRVHAQNRELLVSDILNAHNEALQRQKHG